MDFANTLEKMKKMRETTPPVASTHGAKDARGKCSMPGKRKMKGYKA